MHFLERHVVRIIKYYFPYHIVFIRIRPIRIIIIYLLGDHHHYGRELLTEADSTAEQTPLESEKETAQNATSGISVSTYQRSGCSKNLGNF